MNIWNKENCNLANIIQNILTDVNLTALVVTFCKVLTVIVLRIDDVRDVFNRLLKS